MLRKLGIRALVLVGLILVPARAGAIELGVTADHVNSLWININSSLLAVADSISTDPAFRKQLKAVMPGRFEGKTPPEVLEFVNMYRFKLDRLRGLGVLGRTKRYNHGDFVVSPRIVYVNSGHVLNGQIELLVNRTPPEFLISPFYVQHDFIGKSPDDNFALIDLANRRIDLILEMSGL